MPELRRVAILTGGGDCPGLNAVIRAVTRAGIGRFGLSIVGIEDGFGGLVNNRFRMLEQSDVSGILPRGGTILGTTNRDDPFDFPIMTRDGAVVRQDSSAIACKNLERLDVDALIVAGGDGSLRIALQFAELGVSIVGIPKTIDNDLMATDVSFGFGTAVDTATEAIDRLHTTAESHHRVMVLEVMGRNTGWIALMAGMAGGGNIILVPEIPFTYESVARSLIARKERGKGFSIIVVAEGARLPGGQQVTRRTPSGHEVFGGISEVITREVEERTGIESRVTVLGHLQRGGSPSSFDRMLATRLGVKAVEMAVAGEFGRMACVRGLTINSCTLSEAVSRKREVRADGDLVHCARSIGISFGNEPA